MKLVISNSSGIPIYEQVKDQIKAAILTGEMQEGEPLPSIRQLAKDLRISVITTTRAYSDLEQEGFIRTMPGKGSFVSPQDSGLIREQALRDVEAGFTAAIEAARYAELGGQELHTMLDVLLQEGEK